MIPELTISTHDLVATAAAFASLALILFAFEFFQRKFEWNRNHVRKAIHVLVGILICIAAYILESNIPILVLSFLFLFIDWWALRTHHFESMHPNSYSLGTIFYPISIFILAAVFWQLDKWIFITATLLMVIPDALAGIVGIALGNHFFVLVKEKKSLPGTLTMFLSSFSLIMIATYFRDDINLVNSISLAIVISLIATASELLSGRGSDNLSVPLISALFIYGFLSNAGPNILNPVLVAIILAAIVSISAFRLRFLTASGAVSAFLMGSIIFGFGGLMYTIPIVVFFLSSSILSRTGQGYKKKFEQSFEKTGVRDFYQVWANGGIPAIIVLVGWFSENQFVYIIYLATLAVANADTWATELGVFSKSQPRLITNFKQVGPGTSGAISIIGSLAAAAGSFLIVLSGYLADQSGIFVIKGLNLILLVTLAGFAGSFIDSVIGATVQAQYYCHICGNITEKRNHCSKDSDLDKGFFWLNNDLVNIIAITLTGIITSFIIYYMF